MYLKKKVNSMSIIDKFMGLDLFESTFMDNPGFLNVVSNHDVLISKKRSTVLGDLVMVNEIGETNLQSKLKIFSKSTAEPKPAQRTFEQTPKINFKKLNSKVESKNLKKSGPINKKQNKFIKFKDSFR